MTKLQFDPYSALNQKIIDGLIAGIAFYLAYQTRFEMHVPESAASQMWLLLPAVMLGQVLGNVVFGTYRMIWRYVSLQDAIALARNAALFPCGLLLLRYITSPSFALVQVPLGVITVMYLVSLVGALAARVLRRVLYEGMTARMLNGREAVPILFIGAGRGGAMTAKEIRARIDLRPVAFLDDDPRKADRVICGLRVIGPLSLLSTVISLYRVQQVIICIARPSRQTLRRIWATCEPLGVSVKTVPALNEILDGKVSIANFRSVEMDDLLGRTPIEASAAGADLSATYAGRRILVTGAGGSIGSELALQLLRLKPRQLLILDKDENGLNDTYRQLQSCGGVQVTPLVADIRFPDRLRSIFETFHPEVVFHAAAHKHVHLMQINPCEAITNNVAGTRQLVEQSVASGVARFIQVSTDKAVSPTCIMGASKRVCEMIVQSQRDHRYTHFCSVRFGNVLGSRGSVVPIFQQQILRGGPVTVTHPEAQRFLMTISEAVCLLIQAGTLAHTREIFVLDMGKPVLIKQLAEDLIELSGLSPNKDVRIEITQMKPGEKLTEVLVDATETLQPTCLQKIRTISTQPFDTVEFAHRLRTLEKAAWQSSPEDVYTILASLNIGFPHSATDQPWPGTSQHAVSSPVLTRQPAEISLAQLDADPRYS